MPAKTKLIDAVEQHCRTSNRSRRMIDSLPNDIRDELHQLREAVRAGKFKSYRQSRTSLAKVVAKMLVDRGIPIHSVTVARWLADEN